MRFVAETESEITIEIGDASTPEPLRPSAALAPEGRTRNAEETDVDNGPDALPADVRTSGAINVVKFIGIDQEYLARRLDDFERFVDAVVGMGAVAIYWG